VIAAARLGTGGLRQACSRCPATVRA